jgi:hypothetical protein
MVVGVTMITMVKKKVRITRVTGQLEPSCMVIRTNMVAILSSS